MNLSTLWEITGNKPLLFFVDSCAGVCNCNEFADITTPGRHRGYKIINIKHNLLHQSTLRRDAELQSTHIVHFKSLRDVHPVTKLFAQPGLESTLVDWCRDVISVSYGHLLIDLSPRTNHRICYHTNSRKFPSKIYVPEKLKHLNHLDDEHT